MTGRNGKEPLSLEKDFRIAMRRLAATVNIITLRGDDGPAGMVATAVSSLTADPPSLLICVNHRASIHDRLLHETQFLVNVLHRDHLAIARLFSDSRRRAGRFSTGPWAYEDGAPYLADAQAVLFCERVRHMDFATHSIIIGAVRRVRVRDDIDPLLYVNGDFARSHQGRQF